MEKYFFYLNFEEEGDAEQVLPLLQLKGYIIEKFNPTKPRQDSTWSVVASKTMEPDDLGAAQEYIGTLADTYYGDFERYEYESK